MNDTVSVSGYGLTRKQGALPFPIAEALAASRDAVPNFPRGFPRGAPEELQKPSWDLVTN
jgi:hypothetical protein